MKLEIKYNDGISNTDREVCEMYWHKASERKSDFSYRIAEICEKMDLEPKDIPAIVKSNSRLFLTDSLCIGCQYPYAISTRSELINHRVRDSWECIKCKSTREMALHDEERALAEAMRQRNIEMTEMMTDQLSEIRLSQLKSIPEIEEVSALNKFLLVCVLDSLGRDNTRRTIACSDNYDEAVLLSPNASLDAHVIFELYRANLLIINSSASNQPFHIDDETGLVVINYNTADFDFAYDREQCAQIIHYTKTEQAKYDLLADAYYEKMLSNIFLSELLSYLNTESQAIDLMPDMGTNMFSALNRCVQNYNLSTSYYVIWSSIRNAGDFIVNKGVSRRHAANSIRVNIDKTLDRIEIKPYVSREFKRHRNIPQSDMSRILIDDVFGLKDGAFKFSKQELLEMYDHIDDCSSKDSKPNTLDYVSESQISPGVSIATNSKTMPSFVYGKLGSK